MRKLILLCGCCLALGTMAEPAAAKSTASTTCNSKNYSYLVGKDISETRYVTDDVRLVPASAAADAAQAKRLTIVYEPASQRIVSVSCG